MVVVYEEASLNQQLLVLKVTDRAAKAVCVSPITLCHGVLAIWKSAFWRENNELALQDQIFKINRQI